MEWQLILALAIGIPIVIFPAVFIWYLNAGGVFQAIAESRARRRAAKKVKATVDIRGG